MFCPTYYKYTIIDGWRQQDNADLRFGGYFASAAETYKKRRLEGRDKHGATVDALRYVITATWDKDTGPWGGTYTDQWRCTGSEPYRNAKGNRAKCPYSYAHAWFPAPSPGTCGECGSPTESERRWIPGHNTKDRYSLVRLVAAYCDDQAETASDGAYPVSFPNGQPAIELSFRLPLPWNSLDATQGYTLSGNFYRSGEPYQLVGHLDSIMAYGGENFIADNKTTKKALNQDFFAQFSPAVQMDTYDLAGSMLWPQLNIKGVMIEGAQILKDSVRLGIGLQYRTDELRNEFLDDLQYWIGQAEKYAIEDRWPKNRRNCWLCHFKSICAKEPSKREQYLTSNFVKSHWNPLIER